MIKIENSLKGKKEDAAILLGKTSTVKATAYALGMSERQIYRWKKMLPLWKWFTATETKFAPEG